MAKIIIVIVEVAAYAVMFCFVGWMLARATRSIIRSELEAVWRRLEWLERDADGRLSADRVVKRYANTDNFTLADSLGVSESTLRRLARRFGLKKSPAYMRKCQRETAAAAKYFRDKSGLNEAMKGVYSENLRKGAAHQFRKGENNRQCNGDENERMRVISSAVTRRETIRRERARIKAGLPQKTKLKLKDYLIMEKEERFDLGEYLKDPSRKVVTGTGKSARIVCCDVRSVYPVVAAVDECEIEAIGTYTEGGRFFEGKEDGRDLYFADAVERFDPDTFAPFGRVLVRDTAEENWGPDLFGYMRHDFNGVRAIGGCCWRMCVPYNDETKGLLGTDKDCPERYKWWED